MTTRNKKPDRFERKADRWMRAWFGLSDSPGRKQMVKELAADSRAEFRRGQKRMRTRACGIACSPEISRMKPAQRAGAIFVLPIEKE